MTAAALNLVNNHTQKSAPIALSTILISCHDIILASVNCNCNYSLSMLYTFEQLFIFLALERLSTS